MSAGSRAQVTVRTAQVELIIGISGSAWRHVATRMKRDPSGLERLMRHDAIDLSLADELLTFLGRPDAVSVLVLCVGHPCLACGAPMTGGRCYECRPDLTCFHCGWHVVAPGLCGWCAEEHGELPVTA